MHSYICFKKILTGNILFLTFLFAHPGHSSSLLFHEKNLDSQNKTTLFSNSPVIDKNFFESMADSYYLKGETAFFDGNNSLALTYFKKAFLFSPQSSHLLKRLAYIYEQEEIWSEALIYYRKIFKNSKERKSAGLKLTKIYIMNDLSQKALESYAELLKQYPDDFSIHFEKALFFIQQKAWTQALKTLKTAKKKARSIDEKTKVLFSQTLLFSHLQKTSESLNSLEELSRLPLKTPDLIVKIANFYKFLGQKQKAIHYLTEFQKNQEAEALISKVLLDYYISEEEWQKVEKELEHIQALGQTETQHYFYKAILLIEKKNYDKALVFLKDLLIKEPQRGQYLYLKAGVYEKKKEWQKALNIYQKVPKHSPYFLVAQLQSSQVLNKLGKKTQALTLLNEISFAKGAESLQALLLYAELLWNEGNKNQALSVLTKGLKKNPNHVDLLFLRGFYYKQTGHINLALQDMSQILKTQANHQEALNFTASLYSEQKIHLNKAEKLARKALSLQPNSSYFLSTLGWILFQKENFKSALYYLKKAFVKNNNSHIAKRLGKVYLELKNFEKSEFFFKEALRLENNNKKTKSAHMSQ